MTVHSINLLFTTLLLLSHCTATPPLVPVPRPTVGAPVGPTNPPTASATTTPTVVIEAATTPTPTVAVPSATLTTTSWVSYRLTDIGTELLLPPDWKTLQIEGGYVARPASVQSEIDPAAFALVLGYRQDDLPQALPALTEIMAPRLNENEPNPLTHQPITLGGHAGVAFLGFQNLCMEIFVPTDGVIQQINVSPYLCAGEPGKRSLTPTGQALLASIRFFPPASR